MRHTFCGKDTRVHYVRGITSCQPQPKKKAYLSWSKAVREGTWTTWRNICWTQQLWRKYEMTIDMSWNWHVLKSMVIMTICRVKITPEDSKKCV